MVEYRDSQLNDVCGALADPTRRAILARLSKGDALVTELAEPFEISLAAVSKHVRVLERARLVRRRVVGRAHLCRIEGRPLADANKWLEGYRRIWERNFQRLDAVLEELKAHETKREQTK